MSEEDTRKRQLRLFTDGSIQIQDLPEDPEDRIFKALKIAEAAVNEAIREGSEEVSISYVPKKVFAECSGVRVVGYRTIEEKEN